MERYSDYGLSWLILGILVLFVIVCFRYNRNTRYFYALIDDIIEVRERHNAFDETVRETSFLLLLNLIWCLCTGVLLYFLVSGNMSVVRPDTVVQGCLACSVMALAYCLFMALMYYLVGTVFSDSGKTSLWVNGYLASQGLDALVMVPLAILALVLPGSIETVLIVGGIAFIATKIVFIFKGFRIFFSQTASWVLFLYYLCSLEIVPLVLAYVATSEIVNLLNL